MKVVYNTDQIFRHGGIEKVICTKVNYLVNLDGYNVFIVTTEQDNKPSRYFLDNKIRHIDLSVNYDRSLSYFNLKNIKKSFVHLIRQRRLYRKLKPDVVISPNFNYDYFWLPFILPAQTKLYREIHNSRFQEPSLRKAGGFWNWCHWKLSDWIEGKYHRVIVLNEDEKKYRPHDNVIVLPNPVEPFYGRPTLDNKKVISAGRISQVKGFELLVNSWLLVHEHYPDWELHIYGDDYNGYSSKIRELIVSSNLQHVVQIFPSVPSLSDKMCDYSIYALSSFTECFPTVLLEALAVGLPVVSCDCPNGPRHIITDNEDGFLVLEREEVKFSRAIIELIKSDSLRKQMGVKAKSNVKRFYTDNVMSQWIQTFNN